jgi:hypothetical protein
VLDHSRDLIGAHHHHNVRAVRRLRVDDKGFGSNLHTLKTRCLERLTKLLLRVEGHLRVVRQFEAVEALLGCVVVVAACWAKAGLASSTTEVIIEKQGCAFHTPLGSRILSTPSERHRLALLTNVNSCQYVAGRNLCA